MSGPRLAASAVIAMAALTSGLLGPASAEAQGITGAAISGRVLASSGAVVEGAVVRLRHAGTGAARQATSRADGRFHFEDLPVGGYQLSARALGLAPFQGDSIQLHLGDRATRTIVMGEPGARRLERIVVQESMLRDPGSGGPAYTIPGDVARGLPLVNRDFTALFATAPQASGSALLSVSGQHNRLNSIQVDGGTSNDFFGTGITPGAGAGARSLSLEAIEEIRILVAPFDVRQGGFSGGQINAVTRSGTNTVRGSVFSVASGAGLVGTDTTGSRVPAFRGFQYGMSLGGPIVRDRLHYFVVADLESRRTTYDAAPVSNPVTGVDEQSAERAARVFRERYGFDPGRSAAPLLHQPNHNVLMKLSWQPTLNHSVEATHTWVNGGSDAATRIPTGRDGWQLSRSGSRTSTSNMTTRVRATSALGAWTNELVANIATVGDDRQSALFVPQFLVQTSPGNFLSAGSVRASQGTATDQRILELTDNVSWHRGSHLFTFGTQNQLVRVRDNFLLGGWGSWTFPSVVALEGSLPSRYEIGLPLRPDGPLVEITGTHVAGYLQDRWSPTSSLTLTLGARVDVPFFGAPARNADLASDSSLRGIDTGRFPSGNAVLSPRAGFSWVVGGARRTMLRGGAGAFAGRLPYVWMINAYNGTGLEQSSLTCTVDDGVPAPTADLSRLPTSCTRRTGQVPLPRVTYFDPGVRFQRAAKYVLGIDHELAGGLTTSLDLSHTRTHDHLVVDDVNVTEVARSAEGRAMYGLVVGAAVGRPARPSVDFGAVYRFANRSADRSTAVTALLAKEWRRGGFLQLGYTWSRTEDLMSVAGLIGPVIFQANPIDGTIAMRRLSRSARDIPHNLAATGVLPLGFGIAASAFLRARSGTPFAYSVEGDANGDGTTLNDLAYVPRDSADVSLTNAGAYRALDAYIEGSACLRSQRGAIMRRNSCRNPSVRRLDVRLSRRFFSAARGAELSADVINLPNLLQRRWGRVRETTNREVVELMAVQGWDATANRPRYSVRTVGGAAVLPALGAISTTDGSLASRWRIQLGARFDY